MSISFFIGPFDPALWKYGNPDPIPTTDLRIDPDEYSRELLKRWPHARKHAEQWSWWLDDKGRLGAYVLLHNDLQYVSFSLGANFMDFILWHRTMVASRYKLYLFKSSSWDSLELLPNTTQQQVEAFTGRPT